MSAAAEPSRSLDVAVEDDAGDDRGDEEEADDRDAGDDAASR